jgi:hypothetical protein
MPSRVSVVFHAVAGFLGRGKVRTAHLVEAGGQLPVVVSFVDTDEHVSRVLPKLKEMAAHRLIVRENVVMKQGSLDCNLFARDAALPERRSSIVIYFIPSARSIPSSVIAFPSFFVANPNDPE